MIASGEKKEEYRDFKPYYHKRLYHPYEYVKLHLGYTKTHMLFRCIKIDVGFGKEEWGAEKDKLYYVIHLGEKLWQQKINSKNGSILYLQRRTAEQRERY